METITDNFDIKEKSEKKCIDLESIHFSNKIKILLENQNVSTFFGNTINIKKVGLVNSEGIEIIDFGGIRVLPSGEEVIKAYIKENNGENNTIYLKKDCSVLKDKAGKKIFHIGKVIKKNRGRGDNKFLRIYAGVILEHGLGSIPAFLMKDGSVKIVGNVKKNPFEKNTKGF